MKDDDGGHNHEGRPDREDAWYRAKRAPALKQKEVQYGAGSIAQEGGNGVQHAERIDLLIPRARQP